MRPAWRRLRFWVVVVLVAIVAAVLVGGLSREPARPLDPASARPEGSRALVQILAGYGTAVTSRHDLDGGIAGRTVVLTAPDDYSDGQLRELARRAARLVLVRPGIRATRAVAAGSQPTDFASGTNAPGCADPGARAAGRVDLPTDTLVYRTAGIEGAVRCYGGAVVVAPRLVVLGSATLLTNAVLAHRGVAALDVNLVSADRSVPTVTWVLPGADAAGPGPTTFWALFPDGAHRAFLWLIPLGLLVVLWRARRLGAVVTEPLPVIVRAAEVVEGHGRLYERAGARNRAALVLRGAATARLATRFALPRGASPEQVAAAVAPLLRRSPADVFTVLAGPPPPDDATLLRLATDLDRLEAHDGDF